MPRLVELREIGGTYPLGHSDSWLTVFFVAHEVDDRKTQKALKWRARGRHCNPPAENRPRAFCSRRDDRDGPLTAAGRPASRTVQSAGFESKLLSQAAKWPTRGRRRPRTRPALARRWAPTLSTRTRCGICSASSTTAKSTRTSSSAGRPRPLVWRRRSRPRERSRGCRRICYKTCSASSS